VERIAEAAEAALAQLEDLDQVRVLGPERARRVDRLGLVGQLRGLGRQPADLRLELGLLDPGRSERLVEGGADLLRLPGDRVDLLDVRSIGVLLAVARAPLEEDDEQDDGEDQEGDQAREPEHRDEAGRTHGTPRAGRAAGWSAGLPSALGALFGLGLVEEVELDVVARAHRTVQPKRPSL
jgi:hypothetical protein